MAGSDRSVLFYLGLGSRYSYLAATRIAALAEKTDTTFDWRPIASTTLTASHEQAPFKWDAATQDWWGARISGQYRESYRQTDVARWADYYGIPYREPEPPAMDPLRRTLFCVAAAMLGAGQRYTTLMFDAVYRNGVATDGVACRAYAVEADLDPDRICALVDEGAAQDTHDAWVDEAKTRGVFGVPTFVYGDDLYWGNDRLTLLDAALRR